MQIGIIDSGISNLGSVIRWVNYGGIQPKLVTSAKDLREIDLVIFPGVGSFDRCASNLQKNELKEGLTEYIQSGKKYLGICLGFQVLFATSTEGTQPGMGIFKSTIDKLDINVPVPLPHVGFNDIECIGTSHFSNLNDAAFYFTHSYGLVNNTDHYSNMYARTSHNQCEIISMIHHENVLGCQFHPEKSSSAGLKFLEKAITWLKRD